MTNALNLLVLPAVLAAAVGIALLYAAWRKQISGTPLLLWIAWLLIGASILLWSAATGPEFGPVIALLVMPLVAWCFVAANRHIRTSRSPLQEPSAMNLPRAGAVARHTAIFLVAVPLAAGAATLMVLGGSALLPWREVDRLALAVLLIPVVWGLFSYWATADVRLARPAIGLAIGGSLGAVLLFA